MAFTLLQDETYTTRVDFARCVYLWKEAMKAQGWVVAGSGDGVATFSNGAPGTTRDVITHGGAGAGGMHNPSATRAGCSNAWFWMHTPPGAETFKAFLVWGSRNVGRGEEYRIEITFDAAGFQSGPAATNRLAPEAVNHVTLFGSQTRPNAAAEYGVLGSIPNNSRFNMLIGDAAERYAFCFFTVNDTTSIIAHCFGMDALVGCHDSDFDKFAYLCGNHNIGSGGGVFGRPTGWAFRGDGSTQQLDQAGATEAVNGLYVMRGPNWPFVNLPEEGAMQQAWPYPSGRDGFGDYGSTILRATDEGTGRIDSFPIWLDNNSQNVTIAAALRFTKGRSYGGMLRLSPENALLGGVLYEDEDAKTWCPLNTVMIAWPSATLPDINAGSSSPATTPVQLRDLEAGAVAGSPPSVSFVTPPSEVDPSDPIVVDIADTDSPTLNTFVFALFSNGAQEVVWDGFAFAVFYSLSSRVAIANGFRYTLTRHNGWPTDFTIKANSVDDTGGIAT